MFVIGDYKSYLFFHFYSYLFCSRGVTWSVITIFIFLNTEKKNHNIESMLKFPIDLKKSFFEIEDF